VLTGWFLSWSGMITRLWWAAGAGLDDQQQVDSTLIFVDVNTCLLGALFLDRALGLGAYPGRDGPGTR
jgi:hypothetical protein